MGEARTHRAVRPLASPRLICVCVCVAPFDLSPKFLAFLSLRQNFDAAVVRSPCRGTNGSESDRVRQGSEGRESECFFFFAGSFGSASRIARSFALVR